MKIREKIEDVTDAGLFERICNDIIAKYYPNCESLIEHGINAEGKTRKNSIDSTSIYYANNELNMTLVCHTTAAKKSLRSKWLGGLKDDKKDGDLKKCFDFIDNKTAEGDKNNTTIILTTSLSIDSDLEFDVNKAVSEKGCGLEIWESSRIARYLEGDPDGQYIAEKYFGIGQVRLSKDKLRDLCVDSIMRYKNKVFNNKDHAVIDNHNVNRIKNIIDGEAKNIVYFVGNSGDGKSSTCIALSEKLNLQGRIVLWSSEYELENSDDLLSLFEKIISRNNKRLKIESLNEVFGLAESRYPLVIVIDDINSSRDIHALYKKLRDFASQSSKDGQVLFLCPVWRTKMPIIDERSNESKERIIYFENYDEIEFRKIINVFIEEESISLSHNNVNRINQEYISDPILAYYHVLTSKASKKEFDPDKNNICKEYILNCIGRIVESNRSYTKNLINSVINKIVRLMFELKTSEIDHELGETFSDKEIETISIVLDSGRILRKYDKGTSTYISFEHDRIYNYFLADYFGVLINELNDPEVFLQLNDPFYASYLAANINHPSINKKRLEEIVEINPAALCFSIVDSARRDNDGQIVSVLLDWMNKNILSRYKVEMVFSVFMKMQYCRNDKIRQLLRNLPGKWYVLASKFYNGDIESGVKLLEYEARSFHFLPATSYKFYEQNILSVCEYYPYELSEYLKITLNENISEDRYIAILTLAGYSQNADLYPYIINRWDKGMKSRRLVFWYMWYLMRIDRDEDDLLNKVLVYWKEIGDDSDVNIFTTEEEKASVECKIAWENNEIVLGLTFASRWGLSDYFARRIYEHRSKLGYMCGEMLYRSKTYESQLLSCKYDFENKDKYRFFRHQTDSLENQTEIVADNSIYDGLLEIWKDGNADLGLRKHALDVWSQKVSLRQLQSAECEFSKYLITFKRALRGDNRVASRVLEYIRDHPEICQCIGYVWNDDMYEYLKSNFFEDKTKGFGFEYFRLLKRIPLQRARDLVLSDLDLVLQDNHLFSTLIFISDDLIESKVEAYLNELNEEQAKKAFEYVNMRYGFMDSRESKLITFRHVEKLLKYKEHLSAHAINDIARWLLNNGHHEYARNELYETLKGEWEENDKSYFFYYATVDDLIQLLETFENSEHRRYKPYDWTDNVFRFVESPEIVLDAFMLWLTRKNVNYEILSFSCEVLTAIGTRRQVEELSQYINMEDDLHRELYETTEWFVKSRSLN